MALSPEELRAAAQEIARKYGLDPEVFMAVINGESSFNPAAVGDDGHSKGIVQLFDKGLAPKFTQQTGMDPGDPNSAIQAMEFMAQEVSRKGGPGYEPWHASARLGIGPHQGTPNQVPGTPGAPGPRDRGVAPTPSPGWAPTPQQQPSGNEGILAELQKMMEPKHNTLLARGLTAAGVDLGDSTTLGGLLGSKIFGPTGSEKQKAEATAALEKENPYAVTPTTTDKLAKKKVAVPMMAATGQQPAEPRTVGSGIFNWLRGLG